MRLQAVLCVAMLTGCASAPAVRSGVTADLAARGGSGDPSQAMAEPVRVESTVGAFLVQPKNAEDFTRLLAGESTQHQYYSLTDAP